MTGAVTPMLEKAAKAAAHAAHVFYNGSASKDVVWASLDKEAREVRLVEVSAVLLAIREPDEAVVMAGAECVWDEPGRWSFTPPLTERDEARNAFTTMIDTILGEKPA